MKLNQGLLVAVMVAGSLAVVGCSKSADEGSADEGATTEQATEAMADGTVQASAKDEGFEQDARWARGGRGGFGRGERGGFRHAGRPGFRRGGERGGRWGAHHRPWYRFW